MYKVEITAETLQELGQRLVHMGAAMQRDAAPQARTAPVEAVVAPEAPAPAPEPEAAPAAEPAVDFQKDIAPLVLRVVGAKGKPRVQEILDSFGADKASKVPEAQWSELHDLLQAELD